MKPRLPFPRAAERPRGWRTALALTATFAVLVAASRLLCKDDLGNVSFWPANGALVTAFLLLPVRLSAPVAVACLLINIIGNLLTGYVANQNVLYSVLNIEVSIVAALLTPLACGAAIDLSRFRRFAAFTLVAVVSAATEAAIGQAVLGVTAGFTSMISEWMQWTLADALGLVISVPAILMAMRTDRYRSFFPAAALERWTLFALAAVVTLIAFLNIRSPLFMAVYPMVLLLAFRAGPAWVLASVLSSTIIASALTVRGLGPIAWLAGGGQEDRQAMLQPFLATLVACAVPANNALVERSRADRRLQQLNAAARSAQAQAVAANLAKSQFIANISHEIRTPLNGVLGMAQAMAADALSAEQRMRLSIIAQSGEGLLIILNDILDLSKIEAGMIGIEEIPFDLTDVLKASHDVFKAAAQDKALAFPLRIAPGAEGVYLGDATRLRQIVYNLLSNAVKFTEAGEIALGADLVRDELRITVTDTGIGISPTDLNRLFQRFVQADASTSRRFGGTGLGLAISHQLVGLMGGRIEVESQVGRGASFTVSLPLVRLADRSLNAPHPTTGDQAFGHAGEGPLAPTLPPVRVLAAEDNTVNQLVLRTLLAQLGLEPQIVASGADAVAAWETSDWDIILMDIQMPVMDGLEATRRIRAAERATGRPRTPILALTANAMAHQVAEYHATGLDGVISKPINVRELADTLQAALPAPAEAPAPSLPASVQRP